VLPQDLLESKGVGDLYSLQYAAPAITVTQYGSANVFNIRGLGRSQVDIDVPSGVVIYRDGAPTLAGYFQNEPYFDMESVEVFRGPQGTFVGKNAAGGAVFINTRVPELDKTYASIEGGVANYNAYEATLIANAPLGDTAAVRFGYKHYERDDFYDSITGNFTGHPGQVDNNSFRLSALWKPNDQFEGTFKVDYHDLDFGGNVTTVYGEEPLGDVNQNANFEYTDKSLRTVLNLKYKFSSGVSLTSLTGYQNVDSVNNLDLNSQSGAEAAISTIQSAIDTVSAERSKMGAYQNRLEHTINNLGTSSENLTAAESRIRDVDMAKEMMNFQKNNILQQAATAMLAQANQQPQGVLQLLR
jgi:flagellin-like hook-associated protein FlgL